MDSMQRCQSCGMPLGKGFYGTNADKTFSEEYCTFCWQNGLFTNPSQTLDEMIAASIENMTKDLSMPKEKAEMLARTFIPSLKRWQKK